MSDICIAAANRLVELTNQYNKNKPFSERISMTCKRLQKLLYFSEIEYMRRYNGKLMFSDEFFAWPSGPVIPILYSKFAQYANGEMNIVDNIMASLTNDMTEVIDYVFNSTIDIDTLDLVEMSQIKNGPWDIVFNANDSNHEQVIDKTSIYNYYANRKDDFCG